MWQKITGKVLGRLGLNECPPIYKHKNRSENAADLNGNKNRLNFWTNLARKDRKLGFFYSNKCLNDQLLDVLRGDGSVIIEDFLSPKGHNLIQEEVVKIEDQNTTPKKYGNGVLARYYTIKNREIISEFNEKITTYTNKIFGNPFTVDGLTLQVLDCFDEDQGDSNTILHIDRFVPSIKMFYYPFEIGKGQSPYGYVPKTSEIDEQFLKACGEAYGLQSNLAASPFRMPDWYLQQAPQEVQVFSKPNTLIIGATHGVHRRVPFERLGKRYSIRILFQFTEITKWRLLKNIFAS